MKTCIADPTCGKRAHARGLCPMHYQRQRHAGIAARCTAPECDSAAYTANLCNKHYKRIAAHGRLEPRSVLERIQERIVPDAAGCWLWQGAPDAAGYGRISVNNVVLYAHRVSYEVHVGLIPSGLTIDHLCRVTLCVNPDHLEPVTLAENTRRQLAALKREAVTA